MVGRVWQVGIMIHVIPSLNQSAISILPVETVLAQV